MSGRLVQFFVCGIAALLPLPQVSCTAVFNNVRQEQSSDAVVGAGNLVGTAFRATAVSAVRQPFTTARLGIVMLWHRPREVVSGNLPAELTTQPPIEEAPGTPEFEALLDRRGIPRAQSGSLVWLVDGDRFFPEFERRIAAARHGIDVQVYIFDNDDIAVRSADLLKQRSHEVGVRVLFDDLGSTTAQFAAPKMPPPPGFVPPADMKAYLKQDSRVRVRRTLNPWLTADHTKLIVFDGQTAILGGMNIGREYRAEWHDLMVLVEGPVVGSLAREFNRTWRKSGPLGDFGLFRKPAALRRTKSAPDGIPLRILRTDPAEGRHDILDTTLLAIRGARERVWIQTPYFAHDDIAQAAQAAARRGVDVRVIVPAKGDSAIMEAANLGTANGLISAGAKVYQYPKMTHMKVMICDNWVSVGSANLDTLSMRINRELNLAFVDPAATAELVRQVFAPDFRRSRKLKLEDTQSPMNPIMETIADQL